MAKKVQDFVTVVAGRKLTADQLRAGVDGLDDMDTRSPVDLQILRLLALNPKLKVQFRSQDLSRLDDATKRSLLQDMNDVLGIKTLRSER